MLNNIPVEKILKRSLTRGANFAEIFAEESTSIAIAHENKNIERANIGIDSGYGVRIVTGENTAYGYTNDPCELLNLVDSLIASPSKDSVENNISKKTSSSKISNNSSKNIKLVETAAKTAWGGSPHIKQVQVNFRDTGRKIWIANSNGKLISDEKQDVVMVVLVIAEKDGVVQTGYEPAFKHLDPEKIADEAVRRALLMLSSSQAPRGVMPVVISSSAGGTMIHEAVGHGLEADLAGQGLSIYKDKIGKKVASKLVTVVDDATLKDQRGTFNFDDEGNPAQKTVLIEKGILKTYMHNSLTSSRVKLKSTGNGRRESYRNRPIVRMTNTIIAPGKDDPDSIIRSVDKGLLVKRMGGGQVNTINGDFVFEAQEAYFLEKGKIGAPVRGATLIGNGPNALMQIDMVGTDLGFGLGTCGKEGQGVPVGHGMPTIRIPNITVGGTG